MSESYSNASSIDTKRLEDLRASLAQSSSSAVHRSQTVPNQVGRIRMDGQSYSKLASRSQTMPMLAEGSVMDPSPLKLAAFSQGTATPDSEVDEEVDSEPQLERPLNPVRRSTSDPSKQFNATAPATDNAAKDGRRVLIIWSVCCFAFLIVAPLISVVLGAKLHTPDFKYSPSQNITALPGRRVEIGLILISVDPLQSVVSFDWIILGDYNGPCSDTTITNGQCTDVNIFVDSNLLAGTCANNLQQSTDVPSVPLFRLNATTWFRNDPRASSPLFRTDILVFSRGERLTDSVSSSSLVNYPFDVYSANVFMFAQDSKNQSVSLGIIGSSGNAVGFSTSAVDCPTDNGIPPGMICISVTIKRGALVLAFCIIVTIAVWLITIILLLLTFTSIILGFRQRAEVLIVPVATIFAFTQLRSSMPGAPAGFGDVLDFVGLLPCLGILAFSAALSLGAFIVSDPTQKREVLTWSRLRRELLLIRKSPQTGKEAYEGESQYSTEA